MGTETTTQDEFSCFWTGMDADIAASLSEDQKLAIANAVKKSSVSERPADIRLSFFGYFFVLISGRERRGNQRTRVEKALRPVFTLRNLPVLIGVWAAFIYGTWGILGMMDRLFFGG